MRHTSILAYLALSSVTISTRQREVLDTLRSIGPAPNRRISDESGIPINVVTPRMGELVKKGLAKEAFTAVDMYGRRTIHWKAVSTSAKEFDDGN